MKQLRVWLGALALAFTVAGTAEAQFGVQVSWADDFDLGVGVRGEFDLAGKLSKQGPFSRAYLITSFDYFFPDCPSGADCSYLELNGNLAVPITAETVNPYVGGGLNIARSSVDVGGASASDTEVGLNLLGGLRFKLAELPSFAEARITLGGGEQLVLTFGVLFGGR